MGGPGSGNYWRYGAKASAEESFKIDVRRWARAGILRPGAFGTCKWFLRGEEIGDIHTLGKADCVRLTYRYRSGGQDWSVKNCDVRIVRTPCHLGGSRPWFLCPAMGCGRRVAVLFGGAIFACRQCLQLAYASTRESAIARMTRRADRIRDRLGWQSGILNGAGPKPKWTRWRTFDRLESEYERLVSGSTQVTAEKLNLFG